VVGRVGEGGEGGVRVAVERGGEGCVGHLGVVSIDVDMLLF